MPADVYPGQTDEDFEFVCGFIDSLVLESRVNGYIFAGDYIFRHLIPTEQIYIKHSSSPSCHCS